MSIATLEDYAQARKTEAPVVKVHNTFNIGSWMTLWTQSPNAGSAPSGVTSAGVVPTSATAGSQNSADFNGSSGVITGIDWGTNDITRVLVYDRLWHAGLYSGAAATVNLTGQPSYSSRVPGGTVYTGTQLWIEAIGGSWNGSFNLTVTYTNQAGTAGCSTTYAVPGVTLNFSHAFQIPLAAGDCGLSKVESVTWSAAASFCLAVIRPLALLAFRDGGGGVRYGIGNAMMQSVYSDSCISVMSRDQTGSIGYAKSAALEIASG